MQLTEMDIHTQNAIALEEIRLRMIRMASSVGADDFTLKQINEQVLGLIQDFMWENQNLIVQHESIQRCSVLLFKDLGWSWTEAMKGYRSNQNLFMKFVSFVPFLVARGRVNRICHVCEAVVERFYSDF